MTCGCGLQEVGNIAVNARRINLGNEFIILLFICQQPDWNILSCRSIDRHFDFTAVISAVLLTLAFSASIALVVAFDHAPVFKFVLLPAVGFDGFHVPLDLIAGGVVSQSQFLAAFVAFDQPWEPTALQSFGVDTARFAYAVDPRYNPEAPALPCKLCELGVLVMGHGGAHPPKEVFIRFIPEYPRFSFEDWTTNASYSPGDTVYKEKDIWQYLGEPGGGGTTAPDLDNSGVWRPLRVRSEFAAYLTRLVASDLLTEDQGKFQTKAAADREFDLICERYHEGSGETRVRVGRFRR